MADGILLDSCAVLWLANGDDMSAASRDAMKQAAEFDHVFVSPISAWEIATLSAKGRIALTMPVLTWFDRFLGLPGITLAAMPPKVLVDSAFLPRDAPADPADRIIAATAREFALALVTRDRRLLAYAELGHISAIAC